ncbi:MAG TPA: PqiC family protein [Candidatus Omnitrophota bacterium]|nr:PqiC family protein [Candidatus Omnitrophota bacterium]
MKSIGRLYNVLLILFSFVCSGCLSLYRSPVPKFYTLQSTVKAEEKRNLEIAPNLIVGIGPVEIPEYQNRPQIVTQDKDGMLTFAQFERWGEPLDSGLERLILENLIKILPQTDFQIFPCNFSIPLDYQIVVKIVQLENRLDKDVFLAVQWTIINFKTKEMLFTKRSQIRQEINPHTYYGLTQALSRGCNLLSNEIAESLSRLSIQSGIKDTLAQ